MGAQLIQDYADLCEDTHWEDHHSRSAGHRHHRGCQGQDPRQGGHPPRPAASYLRRQAARGWPYPPGLQHPEGVYPAPGASPLWCWCPQIQPMEEVHSQDALEVEEEAYASPPEEASQDAPTLQVSCTVLPRLGNCGCNVVFAMSIFGSKKAGFAHHVMCHYMAVGF